MKAHSIYETASASGVLEEKNRRLTEALKNLHDWYVEYAKVNHLFNNDGSPATFHELLEARKLLSD